MRIGTHLLLSFVAVFAGFFGGGRAAGAFLELIRGGPRWVVIPAIVAAMLTFVYGGVRLGEWSVRQLPARCPKCRGKSYAEGHRPVRFRCQECEYVQRTNVRAKWG